MKTVALSVRKTILLVDDEDSLLVFLKMLLLDKSYNVITASNGKQAVETYKANTSRIDLVLMDISMPIMNGIEAANEIYHYNPNVAILLMSGFLQDSIDGLDSFHFIKKPVKPLELLQTIKVALK